MAGFPVAFCIRWENTIADIFGFATGLDATLKPLKERAPRLDNFSRTSSPLLPCGGTTSMVMINSLFFEKKYAIFFPI
jgi:hypothetical protein